MINEEVSAGEGPKNELVHSEIELVRFKTCKVKLLVLLVNQQEKRTETAGDAMMKDGEC